MHLRLEKQYLDMGVTRTFCREGHNFCLKKISRFCTKSYKKRQSFANLRIFGTKLGTFNTIESKNRQFFARRRQERVKIAIFRRFRRNLGVLNASAEGASDNLGYYTGEQNMTSSFSNSRGAFALLPPLLTPMASKT